MSGDRPVDRVFLVGLSGAGKSSVAKAVADRLSWTAWDADVEIEARAGKPISSIFAEDSEAAFRTMERDVANDLSNHSLSVVAFGGGAIVDLLTRERLLCLGLVAWLQVCPRVAAERLHEGLAKEPRPMLGIDPERRLTELIRERKHAYAQAHVHIPTDGRSIGEIADQLESEVRSGQTTKVE